MPCDTRRKPGQTISQRKEEINTVVDKLARMLTTGAAKAIVGRQGGIAFQGLTDEDRHQVTDACAYRRLMSMGSATAKAAIAKAEALAGRQVDKQALAHGVHYHEGSGWHHGH